MEILHEIGKFLLFPFRFIYGIFTGKSVYRTIFRLYLLTLLVGVLLLSLPWSQMGDRSIPLIDVFFTVVSSFSDTGLMVVFPVESLTFFGQLIMLLLIILGGLGFMSIRVLLAVILNQKVGIRERALIGAERGYGNPGGTVKLILLAVKVILIGQVMIAILLGLHFYVTYYNDPNFPFYHNLGQLIWSAIFHSVSAFNNAGFDILGKNSFMPLVNDYYSQILIMIAVIIGGIGFPVFYEIQTYIQSKKAQIPFRFSNFTKLTVTAYALIGAVSVFLISIIELTTGNLGQLATTPASQWMVILFQTVSARSAGFMTVNMSSFHRGSILVLTGLMWIGGSAASTAGGIRVTTLWIALLSLIAFAKGNRDINLYGRKVPSATVQQSLLIVIVTLFSLFIGTFILLASHPEIPFFQSLFEVTSAFGKVGFSFGITPLLNAVSKITLMILMMFGQIGVTITLLIWRDEQKPSSLPGHPEEAIMIG